jgi:hypothetical protein
MSPAYLARRETEPMIVSKERFACFPLKRVACVGRFAVPVPGERLSTKGYEAIETVTVRLQEVHPGLQLKVDRDDEGDWEIVSDSPKTPDFRLDLSSKALGGMFRNVVDLPAAINALMIHAKTSFDMLASKPRVLLMQFQTVFRMSGDVTNRNVFEKSIFPDWRSSPFAKLTSSAEDWGRFDFKLSLDLDPIHRAFVSVEMPANDDHKTVWFELTVTTIEEKTLPGSVADCVESITKVAHNFYKQQYADFVTTIIGDRDVEIASDD